MKIQPISSKQLKTTLVWELLYTLCGVALPTRYLRYSDRETRSCHARGRLKDKQFGPVKFLNNWPLQNSTGPRNIGPLVDRYERGDLPPPPPRNRKLKIKQYEPH